jgi:hypothetical protein
LIVGRIHEEIAMGILDRIESQRVGYIVETGRVPKYLFLGYKEITELDKKLNMTVFRYQDMDVVGCNRESHVSCGDKYTEEA